MQGQERPTSFSSPEEELNYLRTQVARRERELLAKRREASHEELIEAGKLEIKTYDDYTPRDILASGHRMPETEAVERADQLSQTDDALGEILWIAATKGVKNALTILRKRNDPFLTDEVHRELVVLLRDGRMLADMKEGAPLWSVLHMTLFEVTLPEDEETEGKPFRELVSAMEQFYSGMRSVGGSKHNGHFALEIAVSDKSDSIVFYAAVPTGDVDLFTKHLHSFFPRAELIEQRSDYNIFVDGGVSLISTATLKKHHAYPLTTYEHFDHDPLNVILNAFSKIEHDGGGAAMQVLFSPAGDKYRTMYEDISKRINKGVPAGKAVRMSTIGGELIEAIKEVFISENKDKQKEIDQAALEQIEHKRESPVLEANIRIAVSAGDLTRARQMLSEVESSFNQFENTKGNTLQFNRLKGSRLEAALREFSFREFSESDALPLSTKELTALVHFPPKGIESSPQFKQSRAKTAPAPIDLPQEGTPIGVNAHRSRETEVYLTEEDRLRHFYIIGQTGTGKTTLMKNMIANDIESGAGVCFIDPHGSDVADVLAAIPPEREKDLIYFDPSYTERVIGLNMLEYDAGHPEEKTFVVNELFSIFQKLYGSIPESMGPMFEQYFRNATLLVLEDPESGSTLLDISRVMSDENFRRHKLSKASNPVVIEFWEKIATKAGGEAELANIVPYITSKFDVFTANDFMRPIIGQQESSFSFRDVMDSGKILLVNLAKGRLGEINSNLVGMIVVGKILMAALSRVDDMERSYPPFYLHIDEFQTVTTHSIATILSEARKYKLGLTIAHQFIAQLEEGIRDAVFGNVGSLASFRVGSDDAEFLEKQFAPVFDAHDLMNIENRNAYVRILARGVPTKPFNIATLPPREGNPERNARLIDESYKQYGTYRRKIELDIAARYQSLN